MTTLRRILGHFLLLVMHICIFVIPSVCYADGLTSVTIQTDQIVGAVNLLTKGIGIYSTGDVFWMDNFYSNDFGVSWNVLEYSYNKSAVDDNLTATFFLSPMNGFVCLTKDAYINHTVSGDMGGIWVTNDGGKSWTKLFGNQIIYNFYRIDDNDVYIVLGALSNSTGSFSFSHEIVSFIGGIPKAFALVDPNIQYFQILDMQFISAVNGYAILQVYNAAGSGFTKGNGLYLTSLNSSGVWDIANSKIIPSQLALGVDSISFLNSKIGICFASKEQSLPNLLYTDNGGISWSTISPPNNLSIGTASDVFWLNSSFIIYVDWPTLINFMDSPIVKVSVPASLWQKPAKLEVDSWWQQIDFSGYLDYSKMRLNAVSMLSQNLEIYYAKTASGSSH